MAWPGAVITAALKQHCASCGGLGVGGFQPCGMQSIKRARTWVERKGPQATERDKRKPGSMWMLAVELNGRVRERL